MIGHEEFDFANDVKAAMEERSPRTAWTLISVIAAILAVGLTWAWIATLQEVTSGSGRVVPSSQLQMVQTLEGGIVRDILIREGDSVEKQQVLMRIDDTGFASRLGELNQRRHALRAEMARLKAEAEEKDSFVPDPQLVKLVPETVASELRVFQARKRKYADDLNILRQQFIQKEQELRELQARRFKLEQTAKPLMRELDLTKRLMDRGVVPEVDLLRLQRQAAEVNGDLAIVVASLPRAESSIAESRSRMENLTASYGLEARERMTKVRGELAVIVESLKAAQDRVTRTSLRAPVRGIVNRLNVNTVGAVLRPSQDIIEIVPLDDSLLIEARIRPQDVAFISPKQKASIKLTAYDFAVFGGLDGQVERISADTITDERGETFYRVMLRTDRNYLQNGSKRLPIIPGMVAQVDILTGEKTVLDYILKPINRVKNEALRER